MTLAAEAVRGALAVAANDLRSEARARAVIQGVAVFAGLAVLLFSFALGPDTDTLRRFAPGLLWLAVTLASLLAVSRTFAAERELGTLEPLLLYPLPREALFAGKLLGTFALLAVVVAGTLTLMAVLFALPVPGSPGELAAAAALGTFGLAVMATFHGAVAAQLRAREALIPMLLLPLLVPLLVAVTAASDAALAGEGAGRWLALLGAYDLVALALALVAFPYLLEE
ncbi:MAG: heme exporter protein CcmB [Solirubrobacteraceae bacterium]